MLSGLLSGGASSPGQRAYGTTLTVFMEGTSNPIDAIQTQIALFSKLCTAKPLPVDGSALPAVGGQYKVSFEGCGVSHGLRGTIFAAGLREQCKVVRSYLEGFIDAGSTVKINFVGLSRGGIGGLYLAQELAHFDPEKVVLNALLFDPVPGNFVWMARFLDLGSKMNANLAMDVSECQIFGRVVVLYPYVPLPALAVHAPLIAEFPENCQVDTDVILGCHQGALWLQCAPDTCLSFARIRDFLVECGSELGPSRGVATALDVPPKELLAMLDAELRVDAPSTRFAHGPSPSANIVRHERGVYLNRSHEALAQRCGERPRARDADVPFYMLDIVDSAS